MTKRKPRPREGETRKALKPGERFVMASLPTKPLETQFTVRSVQSTDDGLLIRLMKYEQPVDGECNT